MIPHIIYELVQVMTAVPTPATSPILWAVDATGLDRVTKMMLPYWDARLLFCRLAELSRCHEILARNFADK